MQDKKKPKSRGNGQGTAYKRKGYTTWTAQVILGYKSPQKENGYPVPIKRRKSGFKTKKDALAYCPILLAGGVIPSKEPPRLSQYWEVYKAGEYKNLSASKQCAYKTAWNKLKTIHDVRVNNITVEMVRSAVAEKCSSYYTIRDCRSLLTNLFKLAGADGHVNKDIPSYIVLPPLNETERIPFSDIEQTNLWKLYESGDRRAAIPLLMIYTGMMPGEAMQLRVDHIDIESRQILHAGLKTAVRKATPIILSDNIVPVVEDLVANAQPTGYLFKRNETLWYQDYYAALEAAGCRRLTPYSCRHTTATALAVTEGIAPQTVKRAMRWSTAKMLDRYAHPDNADVLTAMNAMKKHDQSK